MASGLSQAGRTGSVIGSSVRALLAPGRSVMIPPKSHPRGDAARGLLRPGSRGLSTLLSTWTYLIGKGLLMAAGGNGHGHGRSAHRHGQAGRRQFLSRRSVRGRRFSRWRSASRSRSPTSCIAMIGRPSASQSAAPALTLWFVVWAAAVIVANAARHGSFAVRRPPFALSAQLNQRWFNGSSALDPGPIELSRSLRAADCVRSS